jgi:hypothetical protein
MQGWPSKIRTACPALSGIYLTSDAGVAARWSNKFDPTKKSPAAGLTGIL